MCMSFLGTKNFSAPIFLFKKHIVIVIIII